MKFTCALLFSLALAGAIESTSSRPQFGEYPVSEIFAGRPAAPELATKEDRLFRTTIRRGAEQSVEFAGHYTVPRWGCGTACNGFVIVDSINGTVFDVPFYLTELPGAWIEAHSATDQERMEFEPNSRLMKINGCLNERDCGFYDYIMVEGKGLKLVRKELLPKQYQPESP